MSETDLARFEKWMEQAKEEWCKKEAIRWVEDCLKKEFHISIDENSRLVTKFNEKGYQNLIDDLIIKLVELRTQYNKLILEHQKLSKKVPRKGSKP